MKEGDVPLKKRRAGVLMHITSLPSRFGIGDLGPEAYGFADWLKRAGQSVWQVLPLTPIDPNAGGSPYNSSSSFACSSLLISPELLVKDGLLSEQDLAGAEASGNAEKVDYFSAAGEKRRLLDRAFERFTPDDGFRAFCDNNSQWLEDHALFKALKSVHENHSWTRWPRGHRDRDPGELSRLAEENRGEMDRLRFRQYIFHRQWTALKRYCNDRGIQLFGDIPIYVDHESSDVWANRKLFKLDRRGRPRFVSGVPPDYFSSTGQLWGNPVYDWKANRARGYDWWLRRMGRALELFDMVRLDHFRGFAQYWEVPAGERTAVNGRWAPGPGASLFSALGKRFGDLPIVAEDLGYITPDVKRLMTRFGLPGMKVLVFAFGGDPASNPYAPHNIEENYVVYTGTHDNNTVRGWFQRDASAEEKRSLEDYLGRRVRPSEAPRELIRLAYLSRARLAVVPMQDLLGLGAAARMNVPSKPKGNWRWRMAPGAADGELADRLRGMAGTFGRVV